jgi:molybdopterin-guanine dinucleotide biosynthesis protein
MPVAATKALVKAAESGEALPLPDFMAEVVRRGGALRSGHMSMIAGISNSGKSAFIEAIAAMANVDTLYFSADQDAWTSITRLGGILTGHTVNSVAHALSEGGPAKDHIEMELEDSRLHFVFDSNPSLEDVGLELDAYVDTWDEYPRLIVVDNLVNIDASGEHQSDLWITSELHGLARKTKSHVCVLTHAKEGPTAKAPHMPPSKADIYNQLQRYPDMILTIGFDGDTNEFRVAVVKTREAKADPLAKNPVVLYADMDTCRFSATRPTPVWGGGWTNGEE